MKVKKFSIGIRSVTKSWGISLKAPKRLNVESI